MIEINLLPVREARRAEDFRQQLMHLLFVGLVLAAVIGYAHSRVTSQVEASNQRIAQMESDIKQFQPQLDQVAAFRKKKANLEKKIDVIDGLDRARKGPVRVMDELASHVPERLWLTNMVTEGRVVKLKGMSLDNELVASFLHSLGESSYFDNVDLDNTKVGGGSDGLKLVQFSMEASMTAPKKPAAKTKSPKPGATNS